MSPVFEMHAQYPKWSETIVPGASSRLEVTFDPSFHGDQGLGQAVREVYILSNDPVEPQKTVRLTAMVVK